MGHWVKSWSYEVINYNSTLGVLKDMTLRGIFRNNLSGNQVRIRFCNRFNHEDMHLEKATLRVLDEKAGPVRGPLTVTSEKKDRIVIPAGESFWSDPVEVTVRPGDDLELSLYFKEETPVRAVTLTWSGRTWSSYLGNGDQTDKERITVCDRNALFPVLGSDPNQNFAMTAISDIEVYTDRDVRTILFFGDSITHMSFYTDPFTLSLYDRCPGAVAVFNRGIAGNRFSHDSPVDPELAGGGAFLGEAGSKRFDEDVFSEGCPDDVFLMEGVNDSSAGFIFNEPDIPTGDSLWQDMRTAVDKVHEHGGRIYLSTVMPFGFEDAKWKADAEKIREALNRHIREQKDSDGVIDLDRLMRSKENAHVLKNGVHLGDGIHPNVRGGRMIANAILEKDWFTTCR